MSSLYERMNSQICRGILQEGPSFNDTLVFQTHQNQEVIPEMGLDTTPPTKRLCLRERKPVKYNQVNSVICE